MVASERTMYDGFGTSQVALNVLDRRLPKPLANCVGAHLGGSQHRWTRKGPRCKGLKEGERNHHRNWPAPLSLTVCSVQKTTEFLIILHLLIVDASVSAVSQSQSHVCMHSYTTTKVSVTDMDQHLVENLGRKRGKSCLPVFAYSRHNDL